MADDSRQASQRLAARLLEVVRAYYEQRPRDRDAFYEVTSALAFASASLLRGTGTAYAKERDDFISNMDESVRELGGPMAAEQLLPHHGKLS